MKGRGEMQWAITRMGHKVLSPSDLERKSEGQGYHWRRNSGKIEDLSKEISLFTLERYACAFKLGIFCVMRRFKRGLSLSNSAAPPHISRLQWDKLPLSRSWRLPAGVITYFRVSEVD